MYTDINWDQVKVQASISALNGLLSSGTNTLISVTTSQSVADLLVEQLQQSILAKDKQTEKRVDEVIHSIASKR